MKNIIRLLYLAIPFKIYIFKLLKLIYSPSIKKAGFLKFKGVFKLKISDSKFIKIKNDNSTLPTLFFWKGLNGYESESFKIWNKLSEKSDYIFDIGSNFGVFGLLSKKINPPSKVFFFEPLTRNVNRIRKNCLINKFDCVIEEVAISNVSGQDVFYDMKSSENTIGSMDKSHIEKHQHHTELIELNVKVTTLDDYIFENKIPSIDLIKIDVEGYEIQVLEGFKNNIEKFKPNILIEIFIKKDLKPLIQFLSNLNFEYFIYYIDEDKGLVKQNNIVFLKSGNYIFSTSNTLV